MFNIEGKQENDNKSIFIGGKVERKKNGFITCCYLKVRHVVAIMAFFGMFNFVMMRYNLSAVIVAMVDTNNQSEVAHATNKEACLRGGEDVEINIQYMASTKFNWASQKQGLLLGAYFYGYILSNVLGGYLSKVYGIRKTFSLCMLVSGLLTMLGPVAANCSFEAFVVLRILVGFFQGMPLPIMYTVWQKWGPPLERSFLTSVHFSGFTLGIIIVYPLGGIMAEKMGWEFIFYFSGITSVAWSIGWYLMIRDSPEEHPRISEKEKYFILSSIREGSSKKEKVPWISIITNRACWSIFLTDFSLNWGLLLLHLMLPTYLSTVLNLSVGQSGIFASVPNVVQALSILFAGWITDWIRRKKYLRTVTVRKLDTGFGLIMAGLFLIMAGYSSCNIAAALTLFCLCFGVISFVVPGYQTNIYDIAPSCPQIVYAVSNTLSSCTGFIVPVIVGKLLDANPSISQWRIAFWITAGVFCSGALIFFVMGTGKPQNWQRKKKLTP